MSSSPSSSGVLSATGMVDALDSRDSLPDALDLAWRRAYLADGPLDVQVPAGYEDPAVIADRDARFAQRRAADWADLGRYRDDNARAAGQPIDAVFLGDSITEAWAMADPDLFSGGVLNRGIGGQTSAQVLLRFMADVARLRPRVVHLMVGTNDIAGNTGPTTLADYQDAITAMLDLAASHRIRSVLALPMTVAQIPWRPELGDVTVRFDRLRSWLSETAVARGLVQVDYLPAFTDAAGRVRDGLLRDDVHPTAAGYRAMRPLADAALASALSA